MFVGLLSFRLLREDSLSPLQHFAPKRAEAASRTINEIGKHPHSGAWSFGRNLLRSERLGDGASVLSEETFRRKGGNGLDSGDPPFGATFIRAGLLGSRARSFLSGPLCCRHAGLRGIQESPSE